MRPHATQARGWAAQRVSFRRRCSSRLCDWAGEKYLGLTTRTGSRAVFRIIRPASSVGADGPRPRTRAAPPLCGAHARRRFRLCASCPRQVVLCDSYLGTKTRAKCFKPKRASKRRKSGARRAKLRRSGTVVRARSDLISGNSDEIHAGDRAFSGQRNDSD